VAAPLVDALLYQQGFGHVGSQTTAVGPPGERKETAIGPPDDRQVPAGRGPVPSSHAGPPVISPSSITRNDQSSDRLQLRRRGRHPVWST